MSRYTKRVAFVVVAVAVFASAIIIINKWAIKPRYLEPTRCLRWLEAIEKPVPVPEELRQELERRGLKLDKDARLLKGRDHAIAEIESGGSRYFLRHHLDHICVRDQADANSMLVAKVILGIAFLFTFIATAVQYAFGKDSDGVPLRNAVTDLGTAALFLNLALLGLASAIVLFASHWLFEPFEARWAYFMGPTMKNIIVLLIAGLFVKVDYDLVSKKKAEPHLVWADVAICLTLFLSSLLVGILGPDLLSVDFVHAYNAGLLAFHMVLGVILAAIGME